MGGRRSRPASPEDAALRASEASERSSLLALLERWLEKPMVALALVWLVLVVLELARGLSPFLQRVTQLVWAVFVLEYLLRFAVAPEKGPFVLRSWLTLVALLVPALRVLRIAQALRVVRLARATRMLRVVRVLGSVNRGMRSLGATMARRGLPYVLALTAIVLLAGAAGMYALERGAGDPQAFADYGTSLWWTAMVLTTMGTEHWPRTPEGRLLCLLLAVYAFAMFGYITASLASFFVGQDKVEAEQRPAELGQLRAEIKALREELRGARRPRR